VGTSAGAIVGSLLANGVTPAEMAQVVEGAHPQMRGLTAQDVFGWNGPGLRRWGLRLPGALARAWASTRWRVDLPQLILSLSETLPPGLYDSAGIARFMAHALRRLGGTDRFEALAREPYVIATNLTTGQRAVFRRGHRTGASISAAVAASAAMPLLYKPVQLGPHQYVDGGLRGNASLDVAIERGARLVVCINPMVPFAPGDTDDDEEFVASRPAPDGDLAWRTLRIVTHAGLHYHLKHVRQQNPEVDIVCIEPGPSEAELLTANIMRYRERRRLLRLSYRVASADLAQRHDELASTFGRHGWVLRRPDPGQDGRARRASPPLADLHQALAALEGRVEALDGALAAAR
jgi:predicted acylesterase/phospholipase RssA